MAKTPVTRDTVVAELWPLDGPHDTDAVTSAADAVGELVRYLNHATMPWRLVLDQAPHLYTTLVALVEVARRLPQLTDQLSTAAGTLAESDTLVDDRPGQPAAVTARLVADALDGAARHLENVAVGLNRAANYASHLGHREGDAK